MEEVKLTPSFRKLVRARRCGAQPGASLFSSGERISSDARREAAKATLLTAELICAGHRCLLGSHMQAQDVAVVVQEQKPSSGTTVIICVKRRHITPVDDERAM